MKNDKQPVVAITGGIGSGKSYVCRLLEERGIRVYDCDSAAKRLIRTSPLLQQRLTHLIGDDTFIDGRLNKAAVASFMMQSDDNVKAVNAIVHPAVADDFFQSDYTWMETAILYDCGFDRYADIVIAVIAPEETRISRIMKRDGISRAKALEWISKQMDQQEVSRRADHVIINDGTHDLPSQIDRILTLIKE
ncbi:MAG: dephospho-CoA kinase [Prevotella sp.]